MKNYTNESNMKIVNTNTVVVRGFEINTDLIYENILSEVVAMEFSIKTVKSEIDFLGLGSADKKSIQKLKKMNETDVYLIKRHYEFAVDYNALNYEDDSFVDWNKLGDNILQAHCDYTGIKPFSLKLNKVGTEAVDVKGIIDYAYAKLESNPEDRKHFKFYTYLLTLDNAIEVISFYGEI